MRYKCKTLMVNKLVTSHQGFVKPLCSDCKTIDCDNPIEKRKISILGINKEMKVFVRGDDASFVIFCEGYSQ